MKKIINISKIFVNILLINITVTMFYACSHKTFPTFSEIRNNLGSGVNLSHFENTWKSPNDLLNTDITPKLTNIAKAGFKTVRLPIAFDLFTYKNSSTLQPELLTKLKEIYFTCYNLNLKLILTFHYGILDENSQYNQEIDHVSWIWKQVQANFKGHGYDYLFFELYNEPTMPTDKWKTTAQKLINYIRGEDPNRIYIIGGSNYNGLYDLIGMGKLNDEKLFYTFHFYEPYIFTHQGADWTSDKSYMKGFPYPYNKRKMPAMNPQAKGTSVEKDYNKYYYEGTYDHIYNRMYEVANFCYKNNMALVCTEFGVIDVVDEASRARYLKDVTKCLHLFKIKGCVWEYDQRFTVLNKDSTINKGLTRWIKRSK